MVASPCGSSTQRGDFDAVAAPSAAPGAPHVLRVSLCLRSHRQRVFSLASTCRALRAAPFPSNRWTTFDWSQKTGASRRPAEAGLRRAPVRLRRHRRPQHARRLQHAAADLDPVHGPDRSASVNSSNVFLISAARLRGDRDQPDRVGGGGEHAARRVGPAAPPAHELPPRRHDRRPGRDRRPDRAPRSSGSHMHGGMSDLVRGLPGQAPPLRRRRREHLHDPERDVAAGAGAPPDQGVHPGARPTS